MNSFAQTTKNKAMDPHRYNNLYSNSLAVLNPCEKEEFDKIISLGELNSLHIFVHPRDQVKQNV